MAEVPLLLLFKYDRSWGPCVLVQCTTVDIRVLITIFKEGARNVFHHVTSNKHTVHCTLKFPKLNESQETNNS
jgi:hypothetical protein